MIQYIFHHGTNRKKFPVAAAYKAKSCSYSQQIKIASYLPYVQITYCIKINFLDELKNTMN